VAGTDGRPELLACDVERVGPEPVDVGIEHHALEMPLVEQSGHATPSVGRSRRRGPCSIDPMRVGESMVNFTYGPVDLIAVAFEDDRPDPTVLATLGELVDSGQVRILDLLIVHRDTDGELTFDDLDRDDPVNDPFAGVELIARGMVAIEDATALVADLAPSSSATVIAIELTWAMGLASSVASVGGVVLETVRITAPVVNAVLDTIQEPA
jgi:hypothetical protein